MKDYIKQMIKEQKMKQQQFDDRLAALETELTKVYNTLGRLEAAVERDSETLRRWDTEA